MINHHVNCITKPHPENRHEHITHVGNAEERWKRDRASVIVAIDSKRESFYTIEARSGRAMPIGVVREHGKAPYLRTYADGVWNDNLLAQRQCDITCRLVA